MAQFKIILNYLGVARGSQGGRRVSQVSAFHGNNVAMATILPQLIKIQGNFATFATPCDPLPTGGVGDYSLIIPMLIGQFLDFATPSSFFYLSALKK
jgi:hypothetical protein